MKKTKIGWDRYARVYLLLSIDDREREKKTKKNTAQVIK